MNRSVERGSGSGAADSAVERARVFARSGQAAKLRRLLDADRLDVDACCALSFEAYRAGHLEAALACAERAVARRPNDAQLLFMQAGLLKAQGRIDQCLIAYGRALERAPDFVDAWVGCGVAYRARGEADRAAECYRRALELAPGHVGATINLGNVLQDQGRWPEAEAAFREVLSGAPESADAHLNLGRLLHMMGRTLEGVDALRRGLELRPSDFAAALLLAGLLRDVGAADTAIPVYQHCLRLDERSPDALLGLSGALRQKGRVTEAIAAAARAMELNRDHAPAYFALADALIYAGESSEARRVLESAQWQADLPGRVASSYLLYSNYFDTFDAGRIFARHRDFGRVLASSVSVEPHANDRDPDRPLRIGYLSYDFRRHSVAYFVEPVLARHSRDFHVTCYFTRAVGDTVTDRLAGYVDDFVYCRTDSDEELAARIRRDRIDILVELSGHSGGNRLSLAPLRPAPIQMTWLGYPTTTGFEAIQYRITDAEVDPEGREVYSVERLIRLPGSYYCYRPPADAPGVIDPPCTRQPWITFGSFNHLAKVTDTTVELWARVLASVPDSRLLVKARGLTDDGVKDRLAARFVAAGVPRDRLRLAGWEDHSQHHLALYGEMDIALDTYPYNGATTTCEALWMGVPVVSLAGGTHASRMGRSLLKAAGLSACIAETPGDFVAAATRLASDRAALARQRSAGRDRLRASALMDEAAFVEHLEAAYRQAWREWCAAA